MGKVLLVTGVVAIALAGMTAVATGTHSNGNGPKIDKANGTGSSSSGDMAHVNAKSGAAGENPRGHAWFRLALGPSARGEVVCLLTGSDVARVGLRDKETGVGFLIGVIDGGEPGPGNDSFFVFTSNNPEGCEANAMIGGGPVTQGNFIVHDAP